MLGTAQEKEWKVLTTPAIKQIKGRKNPKPTQTQ